MTTRNLPLALVGICLVSVPALRLAAAQRGAQAAAQAVDPSGRTQVASVQAVDFSGYWTPLFQEDNMDRAFIIRT